MSPEGTIAATQIWKRFRADPTRQSLRAKAGHLKRVATGKGRRGWRWALRDVDFVVSPGESVGLVGINGSGKSTLLKILARVMYPYAGRFDVSGRVGALIEVRAGIHPELTGRENILLYGTLLGLPRRDVASRFDEIVDFAQLEEAVDRPRWLLGRTWGSPHTNLRLESRFDEGLIDRLMAAGHDVDVLADAYSDTMGHAGAVVLHPDGTLEGVHDPRADGGAAGV